MQVVIIFFEYSRHSLQALKDIKTANFMPLTKYLVQGNLIVTKPKYLIGNSKYDLSTLACPFETQASLKDIENARKVINVDVLNKESIPSECLKVDSSQFDALHAGLSKEFVVIQGPPGTGKSYTGLRIVQALVENYKVGPILVIAYKNHALDHFLEGVLDFDFDDIIRIGKLKRNKYFVTYLLTHVQCYVIGGNSDSHSLKQYKVSGLAHYTAPRGKLQTMKKICQFGTELKNLEAGLVMPSISMIRNVTSHLVLNQILRYSNSGALVGGLCNWLHLPREMLGSYSLASAVQEARQWVEHLDKLEKGVRRNQQGNANGVFETKKISMNKFGSDACACIITVKELNILINEGRIPQYIRKRLMVLKQLKEAVKTKLTALEMENLLLNDDISQLCLLDRFKLYGLWIRKHIASQRTAMNRMFKAYESYKTVFGGDVKEKIKSYAGTPIIGMTTTGASKYRGLIELLAPKIVIVEEASEVLEAHLAAAIPSSARHVILLGDHQQLRPIAANNYLDQFNNLGISMFERMVIKKMEFYKLEHQHRMRPIISNVIRDRIYPVLYDDSCVENYPGVPKMHGTNMFYFNHNNYERTSGKSRCNEYEAEFVLELTRYLVTGPIKVNPNRVVILTTYRGQVS